MIDKHEIRVILRKKLQNIVFNENIVIKLDELSIFNIEQQLEMKLFYNNFSEIISWQTIHSIPQIIDKDNFSETINTILNILVWAQKNWKLGFETADLDKLVISYILTDRLWLVPEEDLEWDISKEKIIDYLKKFLPTMILDVQPGSSEYNSYSDSKFHTDYLKALEENDYKGIMDFLSALNRGNHFSNEFVKIIVKILMAIDSTLMTANIANYPPFQIRLIFEYTNNREILEVLNSYEESSLLPLLIGLIKIINPIGNNRLNNELLEDYTFIKQVSVLVEKISTRVETDNLFKFITSCSNIFMNKLWHSIFSVFLVFNSEYSDQYVNKIDFTYEAGEKSFNAFSHFSNESSLDKLSLEIYDKYMSFLVDEKAYHEHLFCFSSYYKYILHAISVLSNRSFSEYLKRLEEISIEMKRGIYSWKLERRMLTWVRIPILWKKSWFLPDVLSNSRQDLS